MKKTICAAMVVGVGLMLTPGVLRAQAAEPADSKDEMQLMKSTLQRMDDQIVLAEVPESQRASKEQIDKLFDVMGLKSQMNKTAEMMGGTLKGVMQQAIEERKKKNPNAEEPTPEQMQKLEAISNEFMKRLFDIVASDEVLGSVKDAYQRYLSADDVAGIIAFYQSAPGQHLLERQMKIGTQAAPKMMAVLQQKVQQLAVELVAQIKALDLPTDKKPATAAKKPASTKQ